MGKHRPQCKCPPESDRCYSTRKIPLEDLLKQGVRVRSNYRIKGKLLKLGLLRNECYDCGQLPQHNGKRLELQLDHRNGDRYDWRLENLRILCPNCHSQTDTFTAKNKGRYL